MATPLFGGSSAPKNVFKPRPGASVATGSSLFSKTEEVGSSDEEREYLGKLQLEGLDELVKEQKKKQKIREALTKGMKLEGKLFQPTKEDESTGLFEKGLNIVKKANLGLNEVVSRVARGFTSGFISSFGGMAKGAEAFKLGEVADDMIPLIGEVSSVMKSAGIIKNSPTQFLLKKTGDTLNSIADSVRVEDPKFADHLFSGAGSSAAFFIPGLGITRAAGLAKVSPKVAFLFGNSASTALEAMTEAGETFNTLERQGKSQAEAAAGATKSFIANAVLIGVTQRLGMFSPTTKGAVKRALLSAPNESLQEYFQQMIQNSQTDRPLTEGAATAAAVGGLIGAGGGAIVDAATPVSIETEGVRNIESIVRQAVEQSSQEVGESGVSPAPVTQIQESRIPELSVTQEVTTPEPFNPTPPEGKGVRQFLGKLSEDVSMSPEVQEGIKRMDELYYDKIRNPDTLNDAKVMVTNNLEEARNFVRDAKQPSPLVNAVAMELVDTLQKTGRHQDALDLLQQWAPQGTTNVAQSLQILSAWGRLTPTGALRFAQNLVNEANRNGGNFKITNEKAQEITKLAEELQQMPEGYEKTLKTAQLLDAARSTVPASALQKIESLQTLMQLTNPKTWVRNILGNIFMLPAEGASNLIAAPVDAMTSLISGKRTKAMPSWLRGEFTGKEGLKRGFQQGIREALLGVDTKGVSQKYQTHSQVFRKGALSMIEKGLNVALRSADRAAFERAFDVSLENQIRARNLESPDAAVLEEATYDGMRSIYENENYAVKGMMMVKKALNVGQPFGLGSIVLKYPRIPANLLVRGLEFSPVGFAKSAFELARPAVGYNFQQKRFVESFSRATVGTAGMASLGYYLFQLGILSASPDDDKDINAAKKAMGMGMYQLNLSALRRFIFSGFDPKMAERRTDDYMMSYDWAQPAAMTISMGAAMAEKGPSAFGGIAAAALSSVGASMDTIEEQPILRGLKNLFLRDPQNAIASIGKTFLDLPSTFVPTIVRQMNSFFDNSVPETYDPNVITQSLNRTISGIPFLSQQLPRRIDPTSGEPQQRGDQPENPIASFLYTFFSPAFISKVKEDKVLQNVLDIYDSTGESKQAPRIVPKSVTINGDKKHLSSAEYVNYQKYVAETTRIVFEEMVKERKFEKLSDEERALAMAKIIRDVDSAAKIELFGNRPSSVNKFTELILTDGPTDNSVKRLLKREVLEPTESTTSRRVKKLFKSIDEGGAGASKATLFNDKKVPTKALFGR